jgi:hypothetical protein
MRALELVDKMVDEPAAAEIAADGFIVASGRIEARGVVLVQTLRCLRSSLGAPRWIPPREEASGEQRKLRRAVLSIVTRSMQGVLLDEVRASWNEQVLWYRASVGIRRLLRLGLCGCRAAAGARRLQAGCAVEHGCPLPIVHCITSHAGGAGHAETAA